MGHRIDWESVSKAERYVPTPEQLKAQEARRAAQAAAKAGKQDVVVPKTIKKIPWHEHIHTGPLKNVAVSSGIAAGAFTLAARRHKEELVKRDNTNTALGALGGVAAADAASVIGGQTAKARIKIHRNRAGLTPAQEQVWSDHKKAHGISAGQKITAETPEKVKQRIYTHYPKSLPGWKAQRFLALKNSTGAKVGLLAAGAAAGGAIAGRDKINKRDSRGTYEAGAAGAGAGAILAPGRVRNPGGKHVSAAIRDLPAGRHMVDARDLQRHTSASGIRLGDRAHVAGLSRSIRTHGYDESKGPVRLNVYNDRALINDGNHRVHAANAAGVHKVPVEITRAHGSAPASRWRGGQMIDAVRGGSQRAYYRSHRDDDRWIDTKSKRTPKPGSMRALINTKMGARGEANAIKQNANIKVLNRAKFLTHNAAMIGGGGALAAGLAHHHNRVNKRSAEFNEGTPYERYSAESQRRKTAASGAAYGGVAAGAGAAGTTLTAGKWAGTPTGQRTLATAHLGLSAKDHPLAHQVRRLKTFGAHAAAHRGRYTAGVVGAAAVGGGAKTLQRFRNNEETGMSQSIGRIKAGEAYNRRKTVEGVNKSLTNRALAGLGSSITDEDIRAVSHFTEKHGKKVGLAAAGTITAGYTAAGLKARSNRRKAAVQLRATAPVTKADLEWHERKISPMRATIATAGTAGLVYGGSRLGLTQSALRLGAKDKGNLGSLARQAEKVRAEVVRATAPLGNLVNRAPGMGGVRNLVPMKYRPALATGLGYSAVRRSLPVRRDTYAPYNGTPARGW